MSWLVRILKEPLLHFLVLAAGLFLVSRLWTEKPPEEEPKVIEVSEQRIMSLILMWQRTWQRPPTREELDGLIEDYIKEEVFYREALAMRLDRDDTLIRRRLRQKMEFLAEEFADSTEPTDEDLQKYLDDHPDDFRVERQATFRQVYLNRDRRGESIEADARQLLATLQSQKDTINTAEVGDPFLLPHFHENLRESEIANLFGPAFASKLMAGEPGTWAGPIESGYGLHLVFLHERTKGRVPELAEVRDAVRREWYAARRATSKEAFYQSLRKRYRVIVDLPSVDGERESPPEPGK